MDIPQILTIVGWVSFIVGFLWLLINFLVESFQPVSKVGPLGPVMHVSTIFSAAMFIVGAIILSASYLY